MDLDFDRSLDEQDKQVLTVLLKYWRINPMLIRDVLDMEKGRTNTLINRLARLGYLQQRVRGLYEPTPKLIESVSDIDGGVDVRVDDSPLELHKQIATLTEQNRKLMDSYGETSDDIPIINPED